MILYLPVKNIYKSYMKQEKFNWVKGFEYLYVVSTTGIVISFPNRDRFNRYHKSHILPKRLSKQGYEIVSLSKDGKTYTRKVHRLVAEAFIPNPENKPCIDHINTVKTDNRVENLRWVTYAENMNNSITREKMLEDTSKYISQQGADNPFSQPIYQYTIGGVLVASYPSIGEAIRETGVSYNTIKRNADGITKSGKGFVWKYIGKPKRNIIHKNKKKEDNGKKPIVQLSKSGEFIAEYDSIKDASRRTGFLPENIGRAAKRETSKSYKGFLWAFKDDLLNYVQQEKH